MRRLGLLAARLAGGAAVFLGVMMLFAGWYTGESNPWGSFVGAAGTVGGVLLLLSLNGPAWFRRVPVRILGGVGVLLLATAPLTCAWLCT